MIDSWSGRPGSNRRHSAWEADVLPLNYSRSHTSRRCPIIASSSVAPHSLFQSKDLRFHSPQNAVSTLPKTNVISTEAADSRTVRGASAISTDSPKHAQPPTHKEQPILLFTHLPNAVHMPPSSRTRTSVRPPASQQKSVSTPKPT